MKAFPSVLIQVRVSQFLPGQVGICATRSLRRGTVIRWGGDCGEKFYSLRTYNRLDRVTKVTIAKFAGVLEDGFWCVPNPNNMPMSWIINHSCDPNCGYTDGNLTLIKNVRSGEELTSDYGFYMTNPKWRLKCECGADGCRKVVTGNDWKNAGYYERNRDSFAPRVHRMKRELSTLRAGGSRKRARQ